MQQNDTTDDEDDDDYDHEYKCIGNELERKATKSINGEAKAELITETDRLVDAMANMAGLSCNLTSTPSSERCLSINKLLEEQHFKRCTKYNTEASTSASKSSTLLSAEDDSPPKLWHDRDSYNLSAFNQINGIWPLGHPLPLPDWTDRDDDNQKAILHFDSVWQFEDLSAIIETKLQRMLEETHYDTVHLFVDFYQAFKRTRRSDLKSFYQFYDIPINRRHHMCVSLAMEMMARIVEIFPILQQYLYIVSCEEQVVALGEYIGTAEEVGGLNSPHANVEKEHAMVAMKINIAGREGFIILDPGYHVGRCVTVMRDQMYPHTGKT